jgi:hypothetical protein
VEFIAASTPYHEVKEKREHPCAKLTFSSRSAPFGTAMSMVVVAKVHQIVQLGI